MTVLIYVCWDRSWDETGGIAGVGLAGLGMILAFVPFVGPPVLGYLGRSWWLVLVPLVLIPIAYPAGFAAGAELENEPIKLWGGAVLTAPFSMALVALGCGARRLVDRRLARRRLRSS
jgi:hypothetical protein